MTIHDREILLNSPHLYIKIRMLLINTIIFSYNNSLDFYYFFSAKTEYNAAAVMTFTKNKFILKSSQLLNLNTLPK